MALYTFIKIDQFASDLTLLSRRYRSLRLTALQQSPTSFSSTFENESKLPLEQWTSRLRSPGKEVFICVAHPADPEQNEEWVGQVTLRGPLSSEAFSLQPQAGQPDFDPDDAEEKWQLMSLYVAPEHRGKGLSKQLCREAIRHLVCLRREPCAVCLRAMVKPDNLTSLSLLKSLGFVEGGWCTLEEALRANGEGDALPMGQLGERFTTRSGSIMVLRFARAESNSAAI
jgi:ribosomal protein S18 acetylase RimI-like enzyme